MHRYTDTQSHRNPDCDPLVLRSNGDPDRQSDRQPIRLADCQPNPSASERVRDRCSHLPLRRDLH